MMTSGEVNAGHGTYPPWYRKKGALDSEETFLDEYFAWLSYFKCTAFHAWNCRMIVQDVRPNKPPSPQFSLFKVNCSSLIQNTSTKNVF
jgi:hypothetical protein